ncbi:MAG: HPr family phosphocarrier protein [Verrucomicrobiota bacterium]|jgi:phosphocarrier protein
MKTNRTTLTSKPSSTPVPLRPVLIRTGMISHIFILNNRQGLHWRPASLLAERLKHFGCEVTVESNSAIADGRNVVELLSLAAGYKTKLTFVLTGMDAEAALANLQELFKNNFAEAYHENN